MKEDLKKAKLKIHKAPGLFAHQNPKHGLCPRGRPQDKVYGPGPGCHNKAIKTKQTHRGANTHHL